MEVVVSRRSLLELLKGRSDETAENFFQRIMDETGTEITWPSHLKVGARSKKDPNIKICGQPEAVLLAKERIMKVLDTKRNKVIMKMDVSYTHHSHVIGKSGNNVKSIMEENQCCIHFPDSNRTSHGEKSNQVSLTGEPVNVENARRRIRDLLPVVISFELPIATRYFQPVVDSIHSGVKLIEFRFGINVQFHPSVSKSGPITVQVRCSQAQFSKHRQGIIILVECLTGKKMVEVPVVIHMEILPPHQSFVTSNGAINVHHINQKTGAKIVFPNITALSGSNQQNKSTVAIWGTVDCAYAAWRELMNYLPLTLIFDLKDEEFAAKITTLQRSLPSNVSIRLKQKPKSKTKTMILKGPECYSKLLLMIRQHLLQLEPLTFPPDNDILNVTSDVISHPVDLFFNHSLNIFDVEIWSVIEQMNSLHNTVSHPTWHPPANQREEYFTSHQPLNRALSSASFANRDSHLHNPYLSEGSNSSHIHSDVSSLNSPVEENQGWNFKEYRSWSPPEFFADKHRLLESENNNILPRRNSRTSSFLNEIHRDDVQFNNVPDVKKEVGSIGYEWMSGQISSDYEHKKELATKAMQRRIECAQVPSGSWAGYGFSQSMPTSLIKQKLQENKPCDESVLKRHDDEEWPSMQSCLNWHSSDLDFPEVDPVFCRDSIFSCSNYLEAVLTTEKLPASSDIDLPQLLCRSRLANYVDLFNQQEVDLSTFLSMSDQDLQELGIPYGARRRMLLIISEINQQVQMKKPFLAAPGAERASISKGQQHPLSGSKY